MRFVNECEKSVKIFEAIKSRGMKILVYHTCLVRQPPKSINDRGILRRILLHSKEKRFINLRRLI
jgi:hypothetical protein